MMGEGEVGRRKAEFGSGKKMNLNQIVMLIPPVQVDPLYHYLHKKHKALVPQITAILKKMRQEGKFQEIYKQFQVSPLTSLTHN